jgi:alpha-galactosidase
MVWCAFFPLLAFATPHNKPIMGWNNCQIDCGPWAPDDNLVRSTAFLLNHTGLAAAGYTYLNLDDAWMATNRTADGKQQPNPLRFPDFLATIAYVKSQGLHFGLYTAAGAKTCSGRAGSCQHEEIDSAQFVEWGIDHVKGQYSIANSLDC